MKIPWTNIELGRIDNVDKTQPKSSRITTRIINRQLFRVKQGIQNLRDSIQTAEADILPDRAELIRVYKDAVIDSHLSSSWATMRQSVQAMDFIIVDEKGKEDEAATQLIKTFWFNEAIGFIADSKFWGHSLIQFGPIKNDAFTSVEIVRREYVTPELKLVKEELHAAGTGTRYDLAPYKNWLVEVGRPTDLGLLMNASFWAIWKKNVIANWSEFAEIFGMPTRIGRTDINDPDQLANMDKALAQSGSAQYMLLDTDDQIEFIENAKTDSFKVYDEFINRANSEMSKLISGETMTSDDGSSQSQANVHKSIFDLRAWALARFCCDIVNMELLPMMRMHGIPMGDKLKCKINEGERTTQVEKQDFVVELLNHYEIKPEWIESEFDVPVEEKPEPEPIAPPPSPFGPENIPENKLFDVMNLTNALYKEAAEHAHKHKH